MTHAMIFVHPDASVMITCILNIGIDNQMHKNPLLVKQNFFAMNTMCTSVLHCAEPFLCCFCQLSMTGFGNDSASKHIYFPRIKQRSE